MDSDTPIDVVITWVDGDDPVHRAKRHKYMHGGAEAKMEDIGGETRYRQVGEIFFCVASVLRFAPFVRKIFIVTDNQDPQLDNFISANFPGNTVPIEIIDHRVIFRNYEQYLPTFNSLSITTMLWRIPGISEHFILLNDDVMFTSPVKPTDFFTSDGFPLCYAKQWPVWWVKALHWLKSALKGRKTFGFKDAQLKAREVAGAHGKFLYMGHTPHMLRRSFFEEFFTAQPAILENQIRHRFREPSQFSSVCLQYIVLHMRNQCPIVPLHGKLVCMKPRPGQNGYFDRKLKELGRPTVKFFCVNSLDKASVDEIKKLHNGLAQVLNIKLTAR